MSQRSQPPTDVLGSLPHRRPSRRSEKRAKSETAGGTGRRPSAARAPQGREAAPSQPDSAAPRAHGSDVLDTIVQAAAELAEIGISATARAVREAVARLPRP